MGGTTHQTIFKFSQNSQSYKVSNPQFYTLFIPLFNFFRGLPRSGVGLQLLQLFATFANINATF
mgnify:CR=1 FL=1